MTTSCSNRRLKDSENLLKILNIMKTKDIKKKLQQRKKKTKLSPDDFLSTGSTLLNLALTGKPNCGFVRGKYHFIVGDSTSGKTFLSLTCLAEAANNPRYKKHRFIFDDPEGGALMDIEKFFGSKVAKRIRPPEKTKEGEPVYSRTIEEFYYHVDDALKKDRPFIYILDSMDCLSSTDESDKFDQQKKAHLKGKKVAGSYGDGKAKKNSAGIRKLMAPLAASNSILIIINQTRDNIGFGSQFEPKSRSGGHALRFYATWEIWSSVKGQIKKTFRGKDRQLGVKCLIKIKKNRITGRKRNVVIPIYHSFGFDDIGSCVDYLIEEKHWTKKKSGKIIAVDFDFAGTREKLIQHIEDEGMEMDLRDLVAEVWDDIEKACAVRRKKRYE